MLRQLNNISEDTLKKLVRLATDNVIQLDISGGKQSYLIDKLTKDSSKIIEEVLFYLLLRCGYLVPTII
jgi:hypothetical protein